MSSFQTTKHMKFLIILSFFVFFGIRCQSQNNSQWRHYTSGQHITNIVEDNQNIWFGTTGGLLKINKLTGIKKFYTKANSAIPFNDFYGMLIDKQGNLWLERYDRIAKYDGITWTDYNIRNSILNRQHDYVSLVLDSLGNIWFGTYFDGMLKYDGQNMTYMDSCKIDGHINKLFGTHKMAVDSMERIWIDNSFCVYIFNGDSMISDTIDPFSGLYSSGNKSIFKFDKQNRLWVTIYDFVGSPGMVSYRDGNGWHLISDTNNLSLRTTDFADMGNGIMYFATGDKGIIKYDGNQFTPFLNKSNSILDTNAITKLYLDSQGILWIGTFAGLYKYQNNMLSKVKIPDSNLPTNDFIFMMTKNGTKYLSYYPNYMSFSQSNKIKALRISGNDTVYFNTPFLIPHKHFEDSIGNIWFLTNYGMVKMVDTIMTIYNKPLWLDTISYYLMDFSYDKKNKKFWLSGQGLLVSFDGITYKKEADFLFPWSNLVSVFADSLGGVWVGTNGMGIYKYKNESWTSYNYSWTLYNDYIRIIKEDKNHNIWFSNLYGKIAKYNYKKWTVYNGNNSGLPSYAWIHDFIFDKDNKLYIGTSECGIYTYDGNNWDSLNKFNSDLPFRYAGNFSFDSNDNLWMQSNCLCVYNPNGVVLSAKTLPKEVSIGTSKLIIYPNPASSQINIRMDKKLRSFNLSVYDLQGKRLVQKNYSNNSHKIVNLETENLLNGVYLVVVRSGDKVYWDKLVVHKLIPI